MRKIGLICGLIAITAMSDAQQWTGSTTLTGNLYRTGNVGIGTSSLPRSLNIYKTFSGLPALGAPIESYTTGLRITHNWSGMPSGTYTAHQWDLSADQGRFYFNYLNSGTTLMTFTTAGKIGVGTNSPSARFHVEDDGTTALDTRLKGFTLIDGSEASLLLGRQTTAPYGEWGIEYNNVAGGLNFWKPAGGTTGHAGSNYHLFIKNDGKVGVGLDPNVAANFPNGYKLYVADGILTERLKVALTNTSDWADYVFKKEYNLLSLDQVENYITENGHLPNVPCAEEVKEKGIDMAQMDAKLLEKIEELTLYMIALKKENEKIKAELEILKK